MNKEVETKKDEEDGSSKKEEKEEEEEKAVDKAMLEMCEQLEPLMPQYVTIDLWRSPEAVFYTDGRLATSNYV